MNNPSADEIRIELNNILPSKYFRHSGLLQKFLRFVVEKTLDGKGNEIKEYTVGIEVLDRPNGFNPQQDASVRIHAVRLRKMLNAWYEDEGKLSQVRILMEKGNYQPLFLYQSISPEINGTLSNTQEGFEQLPKEKICVLPFECYVYDYKNEASIRDGFCAELSEDLSPFEDISVISWYSVMQYLALGGDIDQIGNNLQASYLISGRISISQTDITITVYLAEPSDPMPIWSQIFTQSIDGHSLAEIISEISEKITSMLVDYNGYIHVHRYGARDFATLPTNKTSQAIFWFYHFITRNTSEIYFEALRHLQQAVNDDPESSIAWAVLGHLQISGIIYGYQLGPEQLTLAQQSIDKALSLEPGSQHSIFAQAFLKLIDGQTEEAYLLLNQSLAINPNSGYFQIYISLGYALLGKYEPAIELLKKSYTSNPVPIWWLTVPEYLQALVSGNNKTAIQFAPKYHAAAGIMQDIFEINALFHLDDQENFEKLVQEYHEKYPNGITHVAKILNLLLQDPIAREKFNESLNAATQILENNMHQD